MPDRSSAPGRAWQRMLSGRRLDLLDPSPLDVELEDIAHGLARVARWNGQTHGDHAYSVAQHSLLVEAVLALLLPTLDAPARLTALLHDAPEYVIGDMISPFKAVLGGEYKDVERRLQHAVHLRFALPAECEPKLKKQIKKADQAAAYWEATLLAGFAEKEARRYFGDPSVSREAVGALLTPWPATEAERRFRERFIEVETGLAKRAEAPAARPAARQRRSA
ncbi:YfbR-like 5'-deoxynucleotidase [Afifella sp. IM 167]|uniref:YfbR-like 5'-deoxynucleotidase n=1 Tax=Afifella sp. IM 167 TaxID=2033586 RepID=UPI001CCBFAA8|nr:HD family hydrolase [Afifella sp. IM 167]MBZ8133408.1 hydrolase [Afifella sp. IM 167]